MTVRNNTVVGNNTSLTSDHNGDLSNVWSSHTRWYNNIAIMKPNKYKNHAVFNTSYDRENENIDVIFQNNLISSLGKDKMRLV